MQPSPHPTPYPQDVPPGDSLDLLSTAALETLVRDRQQAVETVCGAILALHQRNAHREAGYRRFADYCRDHLHYSRASVYRFLAAARAASAESQVRLGSADPDPDSPLTGRHRAHSTLKATVPGPALPVWTLLGRISRAAKEGQRAVAGDPRDWGELWGQTTLRECENLARGAYEATRRVVVRLGDGPEGGPA